MTDTTAPDLPQAWNFDPDESLLWFGVDGNGRGWWRIDCVMEWATTASCAVPIPAHQAAIARAVAEERERCAAICEDQMPVTQDMQSTMIVGALEQSAAAIRAQEADQ